MLGGDGSILRALAREAGSGAPVIGVNFGRVGFLASIERETLERDLRRAIAGEYVVLGPALAARGVGRRRGRGGQRPGAVPQRRVAHRRPHLRGRRGAGGDGALRRGHPEHARGLDGLQPRRGRAHGVVARALLRAVVHRPPPPRQPPARDRRRGDPHRHQQRAGGRRRRAGRRPAHRRAPARAARSRSASAGPRSIWRRSPRRPSSGATGRSSAGHDPCARGARPRRDRARRAGPAPGPHRHHG